MTTTQPDPMQRLRADPEASLDSPGLPSGITGPDRAGLPLLDMRGRDHRRQASVSFIDDGSLDTALWVQVMGPLDLDELDSFIDELRYLRDVTRRYRNAEAKGGAA